MSKQYSEEKKGEIFGLRKLGKSLRQISKILSIPYSSIQKIAKKKDVFNTIKHLKQNRRPKYLNQTLIDLLSKKIKIDKKVSSRRLAKIVEEETGIKYSHTSIINYLNAIGYISCNMIKKPLLQPRHIIKRFEASKRWIKMPEERVRSMIFSDESKFNLKNSDGCNKIWRKPGTGLNLENVKGTLKFAGGSVMVWSCFSWFGVGELVIIDTKMDAPICI